MDKTTLLLNADHSIYHLHLLPGELAETIILVGDPGRVAHVSQHFEKIVLKKSNREFTTHTGWYQGRHLSVVSTGIGTSNIDIIINECDALHNIDFHRYCIKEQITPLTFLRLGTCGAIQESITVDTCVVSNMAIGLDGLMAAYSYQPAEQATSFLSNLQRHHPTRFIANAAYIGTADTRLAAQFQDPNFIHGVTLTCNGFYGPQGRLLRAPLSDHHFFRLLAESAHAKDVMGDIINVEMETAAIYALATLLGHRACSISTVLDNVVTQTVSNNIQTAIDHMILMALDQLFLSGEQALKKEDSNKASRGAAS